MMPAKKITALIPCYNEEEGIAHVLASFPHERLAAHGFTLEVLVIDNASVDATAKIARSLGARVAHEPKKGKGHAMRRAFYEVSHDTDFVVMLDGDATYDGREILRLVELLDSGFCDAVIGSRLGGRIIEGSMTLFNRVGNWFFSHLVRYMYRVNVTDVLTGYFAWRADALMQLRQYVRSEDFTIEMEMITKMAKLGFAMYSVPITYKHRTGGSNLRPLYDGSRILVECLRNMFWRPHALSSGLARPINVPETAHISPVLLADMNDDYAL